MAVIDAFLMRYDIGRKTAASFGAAVGADNGNRTRTAGLGSRSSTTKLYLPLEYILAYNTNEVNRFLSFLQVKLSTALDIQCKINMQ